jgi:hypothetical protein
MYQAVLVESRRISLLNSGGKASHVEHDCSDRSKLVSVIATTLVEYLCVLLARIPVPLVHIDTNEPEGLA